MILCTLVIQVVLKSPLVFRLLLLLEHLLFQFFLVYSGNVGWVKACPSLPGSWVPLTATWASGSAGWVKACPSLPDSWEPLATTGFWASGLFGLTSIGWGVVSSLVPTAIILFIGCFVIEVLITLLDCLPSTVVTSLNTICSPLIPSWTTLCCPLGKVASGCSTVSKATTSVVDLSSGLFSTGTFGSSAGVVLKSTEGVGVGCCSAQILVVFVLVRLLNH